MAGPVPCCAAVLIFVMGVSPRAAVHAQDPAPTAFMHNVTPTFSEPADGASVLVVEGVGAGLGGCSHRDNLSPAQSMNEIVYFTDININAHKPTVTEISPQAPCDGNIQDWKNLVLVLVTRVETDTGAGAAAWWGGIMLDEESGADFGFSPADLADLNSGVRSLMLMQPGISWYYTETFSGAGVWSQADFNAITGGSYPAPQVATNYMVSLTNDLYQATVRPTLVTWSLSYPNSDLNSMVDSTRRATGLPFSQWGLNLSNCFINDTLCNDWDGDGVVNANDTDNDNDGCIDIRENGANHQFGGQRDRLNYWDFFDVNGDRAIDLSDTTIVTQHFGHGPYDDAVDPLIDRYTPYGGQPWRTAKSLDNNGIDLTDALASLASFGDGCN